MLHKHQCGDCGHVWEHDVPNTAGMSPAKAEQFYDAGHLCPVCHSGPWKGIYFYNSFEKEEFNRVRSRELITRFLKLIWED